MRHEDTKIVKLGGSVITVKNELRVLRRDVVKRLFGELGKYYRENKGGCRIVVVHGGGSFGHPLVRECISRYGRINEDCFVRATDSMDSLNSILRKYSLLENLPTVSLPPRSFCAISSGKPFCNIENVTKLLDMGLIPFTYGDVVISDSGFEVLSGDTLAWYIAREVNAGEILFVTDVDGLYDSDPKTNPRANKITVALADEVMEFLSESCSEVDVTGGMRKKLYEGRVLGVRGVKVKIVGGFADSNLYSALASDNFVGSIIWY